MYDYGSEIFFHAVRSQGRVVADGDGELDVVPLGKLVQPVQELLGLVIKPFRAV